MTDNLEQRARDLLNAASVSNPWTSNDTRDNHPDMEAVCRALEAHDETQAAFDAYRREVSEACKDAAPHLSRFIIPEPVDPLIEALCCIVPHINAEHGETAAEAVARQLRAALAKIGGKVVFEGEGA